MAKVVLDASAILACINQEKGGEVVRRIREGAIVSAANYSETLAYFTERGHAIESAVRELGAFRPAVVPFDEAQAREAARLRPLTRHLHLSLADRACLGLGRIHRLPVFTADRAWKQLRVGIDIHLIR